MCILSFIEAVDYDNSTMTATFIARSTSATIEIPISDDKVVNEEPETFSLMLHLVPTTDVRVNPGTRSTATAEIIDTSAYVNV